MQSAAKSYRKKWKIFRKCFRLFERGTSNGWDGMFIWTGLHVLLEGKNYRSLGKAFSFVTVFIDQRTGFKKTASMTRVHTGYGEILADVT